VSIQAPPPRPLPPCPEVGPEVDPKHKRNKDLAQSATRGQSLPTRPTHHDASRPASRALATPDPYAGATPRHKSAFSLNETVAAPGPSPNRHPSAHGVTVFWILGIAPTCSARLDFTTQSYLH
jgi:hypothetical protein